jgi:hypothetical protein
MRDRPRNASIAGGIVVGISSLMLVSALSGLAVHSIVRPPVGAEPLAPIEWVFAHHVELAAIQASLALVTLVGGIGILKRQRWARRGSQSLMIVWALGTAAFGFWRTSWLPAVQQSSPEAVCASVWKGSAVIGSLTWAAPMILVVWLLEQEAVKGWFGRH